MTLDEKNEIIAEFMGYPIKKLITRHEYGMDFHDSYEKQIIYCNKEPILTNHEEMFLLQKVATHNNFFDPFEQDEDFEYESYLSYNSSWNSQIPVWSKAIKELRPISENAYPEDYIFKYYKRILNKYESAIINQNLEEGFEIILDVIRHLKQYK